MKRPFRIIYFSARGYVFPLVLIATLAIGLFVTTVTQLQMSQKKQQAHLNKYQSAFNIGYSALVDILAQLQETQWEARTFKSSPQDKYNQSLFGGTYDLRVEDYSANDYVFNVKVRVKFADKTQLFYWRLQYQPNLLDFTTLTVPLYFGQFEIQNQPLNSTYVVNLDKVVDDILAKQDSNQADAMKIMELINNQATVEDILKSIGAMPGDTEVPGATTPRPPEESMTQATNNLPAESIVSIIDEAAGVADPTAQQAISTLALADILEAPYNNMNAPAKRLVITAIFVRLLKLEEDPYNYRDAANHFSDIPYVTGNSTQAEKDLKKYTPFVSVAFNNKIVEGHNNMFYPDSTLIVEHMGWLISNSKDYADAQLANPGNLSDEQKTRLEVIKNWAKPQLSDSYKNHPDKSRPMTIGQTLDLLTPLVDLVEK